ncbi:uncharacterized protein [Elaeis guineensis]|uniref:uncharacterized protein isoform X3 n=1 Tax=Elaeis guineensis var. tenera TaxID=51953 RepID=UPI003C6DAC51
MEADFAVISSPRLIFPSCAVWNSEGEETTWTEGVDSYVKSVLGLCWVLLGAFWSFYSEFAESHYGKWPDQLTWGNSTLNKASWKELHFMVSPSVLAGIKS